MLLAVLLATDAHAWSIAKGYGDTKAPVTIYLPASICRNATATSSWDGFACSISPLGQPTPCPVASYSELTFKRYAIVSEKDWVATVGFDGPNVTSTITVTLDSFDGTILRGRFSGVYDSQTGNPSVAIDGEGTFAVPMKVQ